MQVELIVRIDGREAAVIGQTLEGSARRIEEQTRQLEQRVGRVLLEQGFEQVDRRTPAPVCCGRPMENRGRRGIGVQTLAGEVYFQRRRYRCRTCGRHGTPADAQVCCGAHRISYALAQRVCQLATVEHFTRLEQLVSDQHGVHLGHEKMLRLVHDVGGTAEAARVAEARSWQQIPAEQRVRPEPEVRPRRVYVSCDGIMYCTNQREPHPQAPGRNRLLWQQMKVGCVYWQTADGRWRKRVLWGREPPEQFGASLYRLACRCGFHEAQERIFAADGADWCWEIKTRWFGRATGVLDWFHAAEHVWAAARILVGNDPQAVCTWAEQALEQLRERGGAGLLVWLEAQRVGRRGRCRTALDDLRHYLLPRLELTDYPAYRAADWQIGSGMMESTARQLVGLRLKGPGMQWTEAGALAVTALRAQDLNGRWHSFWNALTLAA